MSDWSIANYRTAARPRRTATVPRPSTSATGAASNDRLDRKLAAIRSYVDASGGGSGKVGTLSTEGAGTYKNRDAPSLGQQFKSMVTQIPSGVAGLVKSTAQTAIAPGRAIVDIAKGELGDFAEGGWEAELGEYIPLPVTMGRSIWETSKRLGPTLQGRPDITIAEYRKLSDEGRIVEGIFEDASNVALAAGAASKAIGAGAKTTPLGTGASAEMQAAAMTGTRFSRRPRAVGAAVADDLDLQWQSQLAPDPAATPQPIRSLVGENRRFVAHATQPEPRAPLEYSVTRKPRGLAGMLETRGATTAAKRAELVGSGMQRIAQWGDVGDKIQLTWPVRGAAKIAQATGVPQKLSTTLAGAAARLADSDSQSIAARTARYWSPEQRSTRSAAREIVADTQSLEVEAQRNAILVSRVVQETGLTEPQARAAMASVSGILDPIARAVEAEPSLDVDRHIALAYADVPAELRPTADDVRTLVDYRQGRLDDVTTSAMRDIATMQRFQSMRRTAAAVEAGNLNPEQLQSELRPSILEAKRLEYEQGRDRAQREHERLLPAAAKDERRYNAQVAINETLPAPDVLAAASKGRKAGIAEQRHKAMTQRHGQIVRQLERAVDQYVRTDDANTAAIAAAAAEVDRLTDQAIALADELNRVVRREQAASALTRASGEVREQLPEQVVAANRPAVGTGEAPTSANLKSMARAANQEHIASLESELDRMFPDLGPPRERWLPDTKAVGRYGRSWKPSEEQIKLDTKIAANWDFMETWDAKTRKRYIDEGFLISRHSEKSRTASAPDQYAGASGRFASTDDAMKAYFDLADRIIAARHGGPGARRGAQTHLIEQVALATELPGELVEVALNGNAAEFKTALATYVNQSLDRMRDDYLAMDPETRAGLEQVVREDVAAGVDSFDVITMIDEYMKAFGHNGLADPLMREIGWADVPLDELVDWLLESGKPPRRAFEALTAERGPVQQALMESLREQRTSLSGEYRKAGGAVREAQNQLERAEGQQIRTDLTAQAQMDKIDIREEKIADEVSRLNSLSTNAAMEAEAAAPATARGWSRRTGQVRDPQTGEVIETTYPMSPNERARVREGALGNQAARSAALSSAAAARQAKFTRKVVGVEDELSQSFQQRLREKVNRPAIGGMITYVERSAKRLGGSILEGAGDRLYLSGYGGVIARRYGVEDAAMARIARMEAEAKQAGTGDLWPQDIAGAIVESLNEAGVRLDSTDQINFDDSVRAAQTGAEMRQAYWDAVESGTALNAVYRVYDAARGLTGHAQETINGVDTRMARYERRRARYLDTMMDDWARAIPAQFRSVAQHGRRSVKALLDQAEEINRADPGAGDVLIGLAADIPTTLNAIIAAGINPTHMIGGLSPTRSRTGMGSGIRSRTTRAEHEARTGLQTLDPQRISRLEADEMGQIIRNNAAEYATQHFGRDLGHVIAPAIARWEVEHPGERLTARDYKALAEEAGWRIAPDQTQIAGPHTKVIPEAAHKILSAAPTAEYALTRWVQAGNRGFKYSVLGLSPKWLTGNAIGNMFMAAGYGGVSPVTVVRLMDEMRRTEGGLSALWERGGMPSWAPDQLTAHALAYGDHQLMWGDLQAAVEAGRVEGAGPIARSRAAVARSVNRVYSLNEFTDNMYRTAVYVAKLRDGVPSEIAMRQTLRAMGEFSRMNAAERWITRTVLPFYPWLRHQTQATLRLPLYSPARAGILMHLMDLFAEPDLESEMYAMLNSRIPVGDSYVFLGGLNPFGNPFRLPLDPSGEGVGAIAPTIKLPFQLATGIELGPDDPGVSRPPDQLTDLNVYGQPSRTSALSRILGGDIKGGLGEIGYQASGALPQTRTLRNLALGTDQWRYASGDAGGPSDRNSPIPQSLVEIARGLSLPGIPDTSRTDVRSMNDELVRAKRDLERRLRRNR